MLLSASLSLCVCVCVCLRFRPGVRFAVVTSLAGPSAARAQDGTGWGARANTAASGDVFLNIFHFLFPKIILIGPETHRTRSSGGRARHRRHCGWPDARAASAGKFLTGARDSQRLKDTGKSRAAPGFNEREILPSNVQITEKIPCQSYKSSESERDGEPQRPRPRPPGKSRGFSHPTGLGEGESQRTNRDVLARAKHKQW